MSPQMKKMLKITGIILSLIIGWYTVKKIFISWMISHYTPPAVTVSASIATPKIWQSFINSVGTLTAINGVDISGEAAGMVKEIRFNSGQYVNKGDILILLDTSLEEADLKDKQAKLKLAQINYERNKALSIKNVIAQSTLDTRFAELQEAESGVEATQAKIKQKTITAPFSGKIGIRLVDIGEYVSPGTTMVTLQSLDPLYVRFNLPEQNLPELYLQQPVDISVNLPNGKTVRGSITAINSKIDQTTRNILVQATIPNKDLQLYPGMYALVKIWLRNKNNVITLPETAVSYSLHGDLVYIIKNEGKKNKPLLKAYRQYVKVGERRGNEVVILQGIKAGDQVVTSGQLKLQNGTPIIIDNSVEL